MKKMLSIVTLLFISAHLYPEKALSEKDKINALLNFIESSNVIFIRNGSEHSSQEAKKHLSYKLSRAGSRIKTARQFINNIASKSSWSGKPYYVKLSTGKKVKVEEWLNQKLISLEQ